MFARAVLAFIALPGVVAFAVPLFGEEPWLARTFGGEWERYSSRVPRWLWR